MPNGECYLLGRAWTLLGSRKILDAKRAADWASEPQANIAQPKRESTWHLQRPVHIILVLVQDALLGAIELESLLTEKKTFLLN